MLSLKNGILINDHIDRPYRITPAVHPGLQHGIMLKPNAVILHRTSNNFGWYTRLKYHWADIGAHFLVDTDGEIFQTARVDRVCWHIGKIKSRCAVEGNCPADYQRVLADLNRKTNDPDALADLVYQLEKQKMPERRYPLNHEAIGIEVVGAPKDGVYQPCTRAQHNATTFLTIELIKLMHIPRENVYKHGSISPHKKPSEGEYVAF